MIERWPAGAGMPVHCSAGIASGGLPDSESSMRMKCRERNETGRNSGAMVGFPLTLGLTEKRLVATIWYLPYSPLSSCGWQGIAKK